MKDVGAPELTCSGMSIANENSDLRRGNIRFNARVAIEAARTFATDGRAICRPARRRVHDSMRPASTAKSACTCSRSLCRLIVWNSVAPDFMLAMR